MSVATYFTPGSFARAPRFPALRFAARAEFLAFLKTGQTELDGRYAYELAKATREEKLVQPGTCAPCLRPCNFTSPTTGGERQKDGGVVPNWREAMFCDCGKGLSNRERALLHFIESGGILPWMRLLTLGPAERFTPSLAALAQEAQCLRPFGPIPAPGYHLVVAADYLHHVPRLGSALRGICEALVDGGRLVFTIPFHNTQAHSMLADADIAMPPTELQHSTHQLGWDIFGMLHEAGFSDAAAYLYWSEELGYLGPMNFIFRAVR